MIWAKSSKVYSKNKEAFEAEFSKTDEVELFEYWDDGVGEQKTEYIPVQANSDEWKMVEQKLNVKICQIRPRAGGCLRTGWNSKKLVISKLERVQSYHFLKRYWFKLKEIRNKYEKLPHIQINNLTKTMFHGMKSMDAKIVLDSKEGLDKRYTFVHRFGIGVYFAVCSDYSHPNYWFRSGNDQKGRVLRQIIMAEVITGLYLQGNNNDQKPRRHPKFKYNNDTNNNNEDNEENIEGDKFVRCDSMSNHDLEEYCIMNIITDNNQAYPRYLITYYEE